MLKKLFTTSVVVMTIFWAVGLAAFVPVAQAASSGDLIKASLPAVYYYGADGKRYVFPDEKTYKTWYVNFDDVVVISDSELASYPIGGNVTAKPGAKMVKITTDPKVYAVSADGTLRWVETAAVAECLYGTNWGAMINDVPDPFFVNYTSGASIAACGDYDPAAESAAATSINVDKGLTAVTVAGTLSVSVSSDTPTSTTVPKGATGVTVTKLNLKANGADITLDSLVVKRSGLGNPSDISKLYLYDGSAKLSTGKTINTSTNEANFFNLNKVISSGTTLTLSIVADIAGGAATGGQHVFGVASADAIGSTAQTIADSFPHNGNTMQIGGVAVGSVDVESNGSAYTRKVGEKGVEVANLSVHVNTIEDAQFEKVTLYNSGRDILNNLKLYRGSELVATAVKSGSYFTFVLDTPYAIAKGESASFTVKGDVSGRNGDTATLYVRYSTDVAVKGNTYGFNLLVDNTINTANSYVEEVDSTPQSNTTTAEAGQVTASFNGPATSDISENTNNVVIMDVTLTAQSNVDVEKATVYLSDSGNLLLASDLDELELVCDGVVIASTTSPSVDGDNDPATTTAGHNTFTDVWSLTAGQDTQCQVRVDINNAPTGVEMIKATLLDLTSTGYWVFKDSDTGDAITDVVPSGNIAGNEHSITTASLTINVASSPASGSTYVKGSEDVPTVGLVFSAGAGSDVKITQIKLTAYLDDTTGDGWAAGDKNQLSGAKDIISSIAIYDAADPNTMLRTAKGLTVGTTDITATFDSLNWTIPGGTDKILLAKVNLSTTAPKNANDDDFALAIAAAGDVVAEYGSGTALGATLTDGNTTPTIEQRVTTSGTLTMSLDADTPNSALVATGSSNVPFTKVKFTAATEAFEIQKLRVKNADFGAVGSDEFNTIGIQYKDALGVTQTATGVAVGDTVDFNSVAINVPKDGNAIVTLLGNMNTSDGGADDNSAIALYLESDATNFKAVGKSSGTTILDAPGGTDIQGNDMYVFETFPTVAFVSDTPAGTLSPSVNTLLAKVVVTADANEDVTFENADGNSLTFNVSASCGTATADELFVLKDSAGITLASPAAVDICATTSLQFVFEDSPLTVSAGSSKTLFVYGDTSELSIGGNQIQLWLDDDTATNIDWGINTAGSYNLADIIFRGDKFGGSLVKP